MQPVSSDRNRVRPAPRITQLRVRVVRPDDAPSLVADRNYRPHGSEAENRLRKPNYFLRDMSLDDVREATIPGVPRRCQGTGALPSSIRTTFERGRFRTRVHGLPRDGPSSVKRFTSVFGLRLAPRRQRRALNTTYAAYATFAAFSATKPVGQSANEVRTLLLLVNGLLRTA